MVRWAAPLWFCYILLGCWYPHIIIIISDTLHMVVIQSKAILRRRGTVMGDDVRNHHVGGQAEGARTQALDLQLQACSLHLG